MLVCKQSFWWRLRVALNTALQNILIIYSEVKWGGGCYKACMLRILNHIIASYMYMILKAFKLQNFQGSKVFLLSLIIFKCLHGFFSICRFANFVSFVTQ